MPFKSWQSFNNFERKTKCSQRFIHDEEVSQFLQTILETASKRVFKIGKDTTCCRAQVGNDWHTVPLEEGESYEDSVPFPPERMFPEKFKGIEGRANPKGISHLYLASDKETAMSEVRPWLSSQISLGYFKIKRDLTLVNCAEKEKSSIFYQEEPDNETKEKIVWSDLGHAFSKPILQSDDTADYIPTQIITELFRNNGFDGIVYKSMLAKGYNIVLFDIEAAKLVKCSLFEAGEVKFEFKEKRNPYFVE